MAQQYYELGQTEERQKNPTEDRESKVKRWAPDRGEGKAAAYSVDRSDEAPWTATEMWVPEGPYSGHGPRNYQRADEAILDDVCTRLTQHGQVDASEIEVEVNQREVTLKGTVHSRPAKRRAEDVADSVPGVKDVHNRLTIDPRGEPGVSDEEQWSYEERVPDDFQRKTYDDSNPYPGFDPRLDQYPKPAYSWGEYRNVYPGPHSGRGPKGYSRANESIEEEINEKLTRHGQLNAEDIEVSVNNGQVTLKGTVDSLKARRIADDIASSASGVTQILNQLKVASARTNS